MVPSPVDSVLGFGFATNFCSFPPVGVNLFILIVSILGCASVLLVNVIGLKLYTVTVVCV